MIRKFLPLLLTLCAPCLLPAAVPPQLLEQVSSAVKRREFKSALQLLEEALAKASAEQKADILVQMAVVHYRDQNEEAAFRLFLDALAQAPKLSTKEMSVKEASLYHEAADVYAKKNDDEPVELARQIRDKYAAVVDQHSDYYRLNYFVAAAYANLGLFEEFFPHFYTSYCHIPEHFLSYKAKALMVLKLRDRSRETVRRSYYRDMAMQWLAQARKLNPDDLTVYKIALTLTEGRERQEILVALFNRILESNIVLPRRQIYPSIAEAAHVGELELAQRLLDRARVWYPYSRSVDQAQEFVDFCRTKRK